MFTPEELAEFSVEALEALEKAEASLLALDDGEDIEGHFNLIFRAFHNIKGAAGMMELTTLQSHVHQLESILMSYKGSPSLPKAKIDLFLRGVDATRMILRGESVEFNYETAGEESVYETVAPAAPAASPVEVKSTSTSNEFQNAALLEFIPEAFEILTKVSQTLEKIVREGSAAALIDELYRDIHSLKGGSFLVGLSSMGQLTHALESCLDKYRETRTAPAQSTVERIFQATDLLQAILEGVHKKESNQSHNEKIENLILLLLQGDEGHQMEESSPASEPRKEGGPMAQPESAKPDLATSQVVAQAGQDAETSEAMSTVRVPVPLLDKLMTLVGEMVLVRNQVIQYSNKRDDLEFSNLSGRLNVVTGEIQGEMMKTRMQPIGNVLNKFQRVVRDLSKELGKKIELVIEGAETELDKSLLESVKDPLTHIIRNSCDHGIEGTEDRKAKGKPEVGTIRVRAFHEGGQVVVEVTDDGKGLHREVLIAKAVEKNLITAEKASNMSDREAMQLIFAPGFSTAAQVTNVSGRGVGMDVVRTNIDRMGGTVEIDSHPGKGTSIRLKIPLTLAIVPAMVVRSGAERFAIPQIKLVELVRIEKGKGENQIEYLQGQPMLRLRGNLLPLLDFKKVMKVDGHDSQKFLEESEAVNVIVLNSDRQLFGLIVDEIQDTADIVVKPLARFLKSLQVYSGSTVLGDGSVALILDVAGVAREALQNFGTKNASHSDSATDAARKSMIEETQEFLLFKLNSPTKHAVFLGYVHRLEEFKQSDVEMSGGQRVIRYRDKVMPLISMNHCLGYEESEARKNDAIHVIVIQKANNNYGIEVGEILDVMTSDIAIDETVVDRNGLIGNIVTKNEVVVVIDPHHSIDKAMGFTPNINMAPNVLAFGKSHATGGGNLSLAGDSSERPRRILFAEDTAFFRRQVSSVLIKAGYEVATANNGEEALTELESRGVGYYDLILSDIEMPKMTGLELAANIRKDQKWASTPLVALTSRAEKKIRDKTQDVGFNAFLEKLNPEELLGQLMVIFERQKVA